MLQPTRSKFRKAHKGRIHGYASRANLINYGAYALKAMSPEQRQELRRQGARQAFDPFMAAGGGIAKEAGDPSGAMLESMNPDSQGLQGLLNRVKKI